MDGDVLRFLSTKLTFERGSERGYRVDFLVFPPALPLATRGLRPSTKQKTNFNTVPRNQCYIDSRKQRDHIDSRKKRDSIRRKKESGEDGRADRRDRMNSLTNAITRIVCFSFSSFLEPSLLAVPIFPSVLSSKAPEAVFWQRKAVATAST